MTTQYSPQVEAFRSLHAAGCFVMPNPWDIGSARVMHQMGFKALATTSAGYAFTRGLPDDPLALSVDDVLTHVAEIASATPLPLNADFQAGYADDPDGVARNITRCVQAGAAGLSIEDATGIIEQPLYDRDTAVARMRAARSAIDITNSGVVLTARCEAWLVGDPDPERTVLDRLVAFANAGADCLYAPGATNPDTIAAIVKAVSPKPVNVIVSSPGTGLSVSLLADLGVRRISVGSALARVGWGAWMRAARGIARTGEFELLDGSASFEELNGMFGG